MKRTEQIASITKMELADLKREISELETKIQAQKLALAFGKTKEVRVLRNLKRHLARSLTIASQKLQAVRKNTEGSEK